MTVLPPHADPIDALLSAHGLRRTSAARQVLGWLLAAPLPMGVVLPPAGVGCAMVGVPGVLAPLWPVSAARKVTASLVASAFFR